MAAEAAAEEEDAEEVAAAAEEEEAEDALGLCSTRNSGMKDSSMISLSPFSCVSLPEDEEEEEEEEEKEEEELETTNFSLVFSSMKG